MMEKFLKVLLAVVVLAGLSGCYNYNKTSRTAALAPVASVENTIVILPYGEENAFWQQFKTGAKKAAAGAGFEIRWESPPPVWNPKTQLEMMEKIVELSPPGVILSPLHRNRLQAGLVSTVRQAIPVVVAASNEDTQFKVTYVGSDNSALGADLAKEVGRLTSPKGKVLVINIQQGMRAVDDRQHALQQSLSRDFPGLQIAQTAFPGDAILNFTESNLQAKITHSFRESLNREANISAVVALDENSTRAAWETLQSLPETSRPLLFGVSVGSDLIQLSRQGKIAALAVQDASKIGAESVNAIVQFKTANRPREQILIPYTIISDES